MEDIDKAVTIEIPGLDNLQQNEDGTTGNLISSNLAMVFSKLPELLAQAQHQLDCTTVSSSPKMAPSAVSTEHYISCIKINGVPILPPVLDENSKKEMRMYREEAVRRSKEREKQKRFSSASEPLVPTSSPPGNASKNDSLYDSLESSQQETVLAQALAFMISPQSPSTKDDQPVNTTRIPEDLGSLDDGSLPTQLYGIPLTSKSEQQITRDLSTLSKHLPGSCSSAASELCDLSLDLNSRLPTLSPNMNVSMCVFPGSPPSISLTSTSSPLGDTNSHLSPTRSPGNTSNVQRDTSPVFKAPIFLTEDNGFHLSVKKLSPTSISHSPSLKASPVVSEQPWIMNSPLIAYVTKKRPKPVGMCSLSVKPDTVPKVQRVNNATFTILREKQGIQDDHDQDNDDKPQLKRPVINAEQRASTPIMELSNNSSPSPGKKSSPKQLVSSPPLGKYQDSPQSELPQSPASQYVPSPKLKASGPVGIQRYQFSGSPLTINSKAFVQNVHNNTNNNNSIATDVPKVNLDDAISSASSSMSPSPSPSDLSAKEHLGDDSLDELLLGVENIGLVPRIDGDGSDVPSPSSLIKDLPISGLNDPKEPKQAWQKNMTTQSPELVRANFSPVGIDSPHHLQVSVATVDVTTSSGIASLCDISADSPVTCMSRQPMISSSIVTEPDTNSTYSGIRRGSYTLLEPSINLVKLSLLTPSPARENHNTSNISDKIPSYADFETALHKRIPSKLQTPKSVQPTTATPSRLVTPVKHITATKPYYSDSKFAVQKKPLKCMSPSVAKAKSANQIKKGKDSFHMTPQLPKTRNSPRCFQSGKSKKQVKLTAIPQPITAKKNSPKSFREWRLSNIDNKVTSTDSPKKDAENTRLQDEPSPTVSVDSPIPSPVLPSPSLPSPSLPSPSLTNDSPLDWDNKIEDQMKCFFSEKKHSYFKLKKDFNEWNDKMEVAEQNFQKTLESITQSKQIPENWRPGLDYLTPDISFTSTEHGQIETPVKQLFSPQTQTVSVVSSQASCEVIVDQVIKPNQSSNRGLEIIPAVAKGFLIRKLLSCPKVVSLRKTIQECQELLEDIDYNANVEFINRINNQLESSRQEIHAIFFEKTVTEKMAMIRQSNMLTNKKPVTNKVQPLSHATQKYLMRKKAEKVPVPNKRVASLKQTVVCPSSSPPPRPVNSKKETAPTKPPENRCCRKVPQIKSVRKVAPPNGLKKTCKVVSVAGKMTATRIVATKTNAGPLRNNSYKPWR